MLLPSFFLSFGLNVLLYKETNSRRLCDVLGLAFGCGSYTPVTEWIRSYTELTKPNVDTEMDIVLGTDNEQKVGKTYTTSIHSNVKTSCISMVVSFELKLPESIQGHEDGNSSTWRFTECDFENTQKQN